MTARAEVFCFIVIAIHLGSLFVHGAAAASEEFSRHEVVWPRVRHAPSPRNKRQVPQQRLTQGERFPPELEIFLDVKGQQLILDLKINSGLLADTYFEKQQRVDGGHVIYQPGQEDVELCQYHGKVRGLVGSWAAVSTCDGVSGVVFDGQELHHIEPASSSRSRDGAHLVFSHRHLQTNSSCGVTSGDLFHMLDHKENHARHRRSVVTAHVKRGTAYYIEFLLVVDNMTFKKLGSEPARVSRHCKNLANIVNAVYSPLQVVVALVGVVMWSQRDEINEPSTSTLDEFLVYRRNHLLKNHPNDNAHLLVGRQVESNVVGRASIGTICTHDHSGGVVVEHSDLVSLVALTMSHELGHNLGMSHDADVPGCRCPDQHCVMASSILKLDQTKWSSCSAEALTKTLESGLDYCLHNEPKRLFEGPMCGNGFVEEGEECDCGPVEYCTTACCVASTCRLAANATCATGPCCDLDTCKPLRGGTECRPARGECDLPEFCRGDSESCPGNFFKGDGEACENGDGFCYSGRCGSHERQCKLLWGPKSKSAPDICYQMNTKGVMGMNCQYDYDTKIYKKCEKKDVQCGRLQCSRQYDKLVFGQGHAEYMSSYFTVKDVSCHAVNLNLGPESGDPGLVPDGARCGPDKICVRQHCVPMSYEQANCSMRCNGHGVCNNVGHCHCERGYAPPFCVDLGFGGSEDSGPASDPDAYTPLTGFLIFLGAMVFMTIVLFLMVCYFKRFGNNSTLSSSALRITKKQATSKQRVKNPALPATSTNSSSKRNVDISLPISNDQLVGQHRGFSISPLKHKKPMQRDGSSAASSSRSPSREAPPPPPPAGVSVTRTSAIFEPHAPAGSKTSSVTKPPAVFSSKSAEIKTKFMSSKTNSVSSEIKPSVPKQSTSNSNDSNKAVVINNPIKTVEKPSAKQISSKIVIVTSPKNNKPKTEAGQPNLSKTKKFEKDSPNTALLQQPNTVSKLAKQFEK